MLTRNVASLLVAVVALSSALAFQLPRQNNYLPPPPTTTRFTSSTKTTILLGQQHGATTSKLFLSKENEGIQRPGNNNGRWRRTVLALQQVMRNVLAYPRRFAARFKGLSKVGKTIVLMQVLIISLLFGSVGKTIYVNTHGGRSTAAPIEIPYSNFMDIVEKRNSKELPGLSIENVRIGSDKIIYRLVQEPETSGGERSAAIAFTRQVPNPNPELLSRLRQNNVPFGAMPKPGPNPVAVVARSAILMFYMLILFRMYRTFSGNSSSDVPGKLATKNLPLASFDDIQGIDEAKNEVMELVDTLRNPSKYAILGARAPTGLLLEGPPGTGKTMLARATAAAAGVPLLYCSGSDFVEMFVGRGAARVRKMFERASKLSPCIIFVDELDALGKSRDSGNALLRNGGNDEAEQTLNQLLACMDGLDSTKRICVLAATNRKEVLDSALIRPGRFDRIVTLKLPNAKGRENILRVHAEKLPGFKRGIGVDSSRPGSLGQGDTVDLSAVASVTDGLSGAELEFIVNEAAIRAVRRVSAAINQGDNQVTPHVLPQDFEESIRNFYATRKPKDGLFGVFK